MINLTPRYYTQKQISYITGLSRTTLERKEKLGLMPEPIRFGPRQKRYPIDKIELWIAGKDWKQQSEEAAA